MNDNTDITKKLYEYRDFIEQSFDIILAVNMYDGKYEQVVYHRPDFYSASERGNASVLYESITPLLNSDEDEEEFFSPEAIRNFYRSSLKSVSSQKIKLSHRNGARWITVRLVKSDNYPEYVFVCVKEMTRDVSFWDTNDLIQVVGNKYSSILSVNVTLNECHLIAGEAGKKGRSVASYTRFLEGLAGAAAEAYRNEILSKLSQTFLISKANERPLDVLEYPDESGEHWYSLQFRYVKSMLTDNVCGLLFIACIDEEIKEKRERANLSYQLFTIGHRLFKMYVSVDLDSDRYCINRFDGDKRFDHLLVGCYSQNVGSIFKYVPEADRKKILSENSLDNLKERAADNDFAERSYSFSTIGKEGVTREMEVIIGVTAAEERAGAFIAVRDVTEQNALKRTEEREKEIINLLGKNNDLAFTMDISSLRLSYLKRPSNTKNVFQENGDYKTMMEKLSEIYVPEEDQEYVVIMTRPETVLKEIRKDGRFRFSHKWKKDGRTFWTEWTIMPLASDPKLLLGQAKNVTEEYAAEMRRLRSEAELRELKLKNDELSHAVMTDEFGLDNLAAFEKYKDVKRDGVVAYIAINDWLSLYHTRVFASIVREARRAFAPEKAFRFGGGEMVFVVNEANYAKGYEAFLNFSKQKGISFELGVSAEEDTLTAVNAAYKNRKKV